MRGTHVDYAGKIGMVNILSEASVGSGVRRVDALVGQSAYDYNAREHALVSQLSDTLNARPDELAEREHAARQAQGFRPQARVDV